MNPFLHKIAKPAFLFQYDQTILIKCKKSDVTLFENSLFISKHIKFISIELAR